MLSIRLRRMGAANAPFYRVVVSDSRRTPRSSAVEELGYYNPSANPSVVALNRERVRHWVSQGAQMSDTVSQLVRRLDTEASSGAAGVSASG